MPITMSIEVPENKSEHSATLVIDFGAYIELFRKVNRQEATPEDTIQFNELKKSLVQQTSNTLLGAGTQKGMSYLLQGLFDEIIDKYYLQEQEMIRKSPAFQNLGDGCHELVKNAIDVFLQHCLEHPEIIKNTLEFDMRIELSEQHVKITFQDSGPGFPPSLLNKWQTSEDQITYVNTKAVSIKKQQEIQGLLGGQGLGLRQLMCQSLTATKLNPNTIAEKPEGFDAKMRFSNGESPFSGAKIEIETQTMPYVNAHTPRRVFMPASPGGEPMAMEEDELGEFIIGTPVGRGRDLTGESPTSAADIPVTPNYSVKTTEFKEKYSALREAGEHKKSSDEAPKSPK